MKPARRIIASTPTSIATNKQKWTTSLPSNMYCNYLVRTTAPPHHSAPQSISSVNKRLQVKRDYIHCCFPSQCRYRRLCYWRTRIGALTCTFTRTYRYLTHTYSPLHRSSWVFRLCRENLILRRFRTFLTRNLICNCANTHKRTFIYHTRTRIQNRTHTHPERTISDRTRTRMYIRPCHRRLCQLLLRISA